MDTKILTDIGLTPDEATIYMVLLDGGLMPARTVALRASLGRPLTYKILDDLIVKGVVEKKETGGKIALFAPVHPRELEILFEKKKEEIENTKKGLTEALGQMISKYNLFIGKPNIQFFEGKEGVANVVRDSYTSQTEILTYADNEAMNKYYPELNKENLIARKKSNIKKRLISIDTPYIRELAKNDNPHITERRVISNIGAFAAAMQIYDNKVSYIVLKADRAIAMIIEDEAVAAMQRTLFEVIWSQAKPLGHQTPASQG
jgi:sugar-specific transcriptional regulator TrmB